MIPGEYMTECDFGPDNTYYTVTYGSLVMVFGLLICLCRDAERHIASLWLLCIYGILLFLLAIQIMTTFNDVPYTDKSDYCRILRYFFPIVTVLTGIILLADYVLELKYR